jgi:hypothetical protein
MPEEIPLAPPPPETPAAKAPAADPPKAAAAPLIDAGKARAQAEYYARHPEELEATLQHLEQATGVGIRSEVNKLRLEIDERDVISDFGLTRDDIPFIKGNSREEMIAKATALKKRLEGAAPSATTPQKTIVPITMMGQQPGSPSAPKPPQISEVVRGGNGQPSVEAAKDALRKAMEKIEYQ